MKPHILFGGIGIVVGLAGGTGYSIATAPPPADHTAAADSTHQIASADSLGEHGDTFVPGDSTAGADTTGTPGAIGSDSTGAAAVDSTPDTGPAQPAAELVADVAAAAGLEVTATPRSPNAPADSLLGPERVARIVGMMQPADAAKLFEQLENIQARDVLVRLSDRKAAAILAAMPADRSAELGKLLLRK